MLTVDDYGAIRRARRDGLSIRAIAREFGHSRRIIRHVLTHAEPPPVRTRRRPAPLLGPVESIMGFFAYRPENHQSRIAAMLHRLTIGYLDPAAVRERRVAVLTPLDMGVVCRLLGELGESDAAGRPTLGGCRVELHDGYVVCPWLMPSPVPEAVAFARRLRDETGCLLADVQHGQVVTPEIFERESAEDEPGWHRQH
jgi:hypothetical protein